MLRVELGLRFLISAYNPFKKYKGGLLPRVKDTTKSLHRIGETYTKKMLGEMHRILRILRNMKSETLVN